MKKIKSIIIIVLLFCSSALLAQNWVKMMNDPNVNFHETQKVFYQYVEKYKTNYRQINGTEPTRIPGYKQFKRWEWFMAPRVSEIGERFASNVVWQEMQKHKIQSRTGGAGNWTFIGPSNTSALAGAGRLNFIRVHPNDPNKLYVGAPAGGLWISDDGGGSWTTNTDLLNHVIGCTDIAFDPVDPNVMYLATGDGDAGDNYSVGLLKSTDGAATWKTTGLSFNTSQFKEINKVFVDSSNRNNIIVASTAGIFRSTDASTTFTQVQPGSFKDMEVKPGTPSTLYACGVQFFKSTNGGVGWTKTTAGLPDSNIIIRMAIAVTPADPEVIYLVAMLADTYDMEGFYKSTNGGTSFSKISTPDIGNQGWYDLCIAASPDNSQEVLLGGQTQFLKSTNGGNSWNNSGGSSHVDYHDVIYTTGTTCYLTSDGGIWKSTNSAGSWSKLNSNLAIAQMYGFGQSVSNPDLLINGWQDNGTNIYNGSWQQAIGADGMLAFISWSNDNYMWGSIQNGGLQRSVNGGNSWYSATTGITEMCPWVTQWNEDPITPNVLYAGCENVWISTNGGQNWNLPSYVDFGNSSAITAISVSPINNQIIWTAKDKSLYVSVDGGAFWAPIPNLPSGSITSIACDFKNENKAWVTYSGFNNSNKVFQTSDLGDTWVNLSPSVPNIPVNCIAVDKNGKDALYIGTDAGVFFKDSSMSVWEPFKNGLPNVVVTQLHIFYANSKIRASTYGRGMWESDLFQPGNFPLVANFAGNNLIGCPGLGTQYSDYSTGKPTSWKWSFPGGNPTVSTQQNPFVGYSTPGTYSVTLIVSNTTGKDTLTFNNYISVGTSNKPAPTTTGVKFCGPNKTVNLSASGSGSGTIRWWDKFAGGNMVGTGSAFSPTISGTHTYYADEKFISGNSDSVGAKNKNIGGGNVFTANDIRGLFFDILEPVTINSFQVYANSSDYRTIEILDENGNMYYSTTVFIQSISNAATTVNVDIPMYIGKNYFIKFTGLVDCFRNSSGAVYPYTSSAINITESNASIPGYYYFFYNWKYSKAECNTARTACVATDTCFTGIETVDVFSDNAISVFPNPNEGMFSVDFYVAKRDNFDIQVYNALGQTVYKEDLKNFTGNYYRKVDITSFNPGVYLLKVSNSKNQAVKKIIMY